MKNFVQKGEIVTIAAPYALSSGDPALVGSLFGIAATNAASGAEVEAMTVGVFHLPKKTGEAWVAGDKIYWNDTARECTTTATGNNLVGVALAAAASAATTGVVRLNGFIG